LTDQTKTLFCGFATAAAMGIRGIRHLLQNVGWIEEESVDDGKPSNGNSNGRIWKEWKASDAFLGKSSNGCLPLEKIPSNAKLWIDGNGLAFYLHSIAYTRYLSNLDHYKNNDRGMIPSNSHQQTFVCPTTKEIMADAIATTLALPCMLPLSILRAVTKEFVIGLKNHVGTIRVMWDGPCRRFKAKTDAERKLARDREESYLELYCNHGTLVAQKKNLHYANEWKEVFPLTKLFGTCVRHALQELLVENIECPEEADVALAQTASGDSLSYVVGFDSDFFFYKGIQYIPLNQLSIQPSGLHAFVARRSELSRLLGFDNDDRLIDLALLMGNDYVEPYLCLETPKEVDLTSVQSMIYYLQCHEDYFVTAKNDNTRAPVDFVRSLYNLHSLEAFPLDETLAPKREDDNANHHHKRVLQPDDTMVRNGILRYLQAKLDATDPDDRKFHLTEQALQAFELTSTPEGRQSFSTLEIRPTYAEMKAAKYIELCISRCYRESPDSLLIRATPPDYLMSRIHFHAALASFRSPEAETEEPLHEEALEEEATPEPISLPIDEHEESILENIRNHRVTIIHGETGCGKSSRVPVMLLKNPPPQNELSKVKFFISQPRRIAAKALVERVRSCEPDLRDKFALRMGHGWREYESNHTQAYFCTTGYLVRLLANHPERFDDCTHLVIDEVHERSVDTDILCLLCRRLLQTNKTIRLVLMSATLATKMYKEYFGVLNEPIHVGVRTYPITEYYVEDLQQFGISQKELRAANAIENECNTKFCIAAPVAKEMKHRFNLAARLSIIVADPGTSVLIFVPGMAEIIAISELIETYHTAGIRYTTFPIHGDIPFEEQMDAFNAPEEDEVKIVIATNAAESSVTLPNVDHVICLGLCRQIVYNQASHRQMLTSAWISKASAKQRAGRTGRVRPGNVYRLYSKKAFDSYMSEFEPGEMVRIPLDSVILMLKQILHEEVIPIFRECLEPPALHTIEQSFQSLKYWNFITQANDKADITPLGSFVSALGIDLSLGSFVGLGIQFGVAAEAIEMAAMMSLPKTPFQITSPMWLSPGKFNKLASQTYSSKCKFDAGLYSEPMGLMNAIWDSESLGSTNKKYSWTVKNNIAMKRWQQVISSRNSLRKRVADFLGIDEEKLKVQLPPRDMPREKVTILRILKLWVFSDSIIECSPSKLKASSDGSVVLSVKSRSSVNLDEEHLDKMLKPERHPYRIVDQNETEQFGVFEEEGGFSFPRFVESFESRLLSYISEKDIGVALCYSNQELSLFIEKSNASSSYGPLRNIVEMIGGGRNLEERFTYDFSNKKRRGIQERPSGIWTVTNTPNIKDPFTRKKEFVRIDLNAYDTSYDFGSICASIIHEVSGCDIKSKMVWHFFTKVKSKKKSKKNASQPFYVTTMGECQKVSNPDLEDLLGRKPMSVTTNAKNCVQTIVVAHPPKSQQPDVNVFQEPLFADIPEGARVLALLASSQRRGKFHTLRIPQSNNDMDCEETYDFKMKEEEIDVAKRWRRLDSSNPVYVDDSVPSTAIHTTQQLYAVASNSLDIQSGGMRVEGLTLLPPNPLFVILSHLSFGIEVNAPLSWALVYNSSEGADAKIKKKVKKSYDWLKIRASKVPKALGSFGDHLIVSALSDVPSSEVKIWHEEEIKYLLKQAIVFNEGAMSMEETLVCFPDKVQELCDLFSGVDGHSLSVWDSIEDESLTEKNLSKWQWERKSSANIRQHPRQFPSSASEQKATSKKVEPKKNGSTNPMKKRREAPAKQPQARGCNGDSQKTCKIRQFDEELVDASKEWFAVTLQEGEEMPVFPSSNILALILQQYGNIDDSNGAKKRNYVVALNTANWDIVCLEGEGGKSLYKASFVNSSIPTTPVLGRGKNKLPKWIKKNRRPTTLEEAKECVPPGVKCPMILQNSDGDLLFESIEDAVKMESAFWLNQQFCHAGKNFTRHWFAHSMDQMIEVLQKHSNNN